MGAKASRGVPPRKPVPEGKIRLCEAGYLSSPHTGRARQIIGYIAAKYPNEYESWFYFDSGKYFFAFLKEVFDPVPFPEHLKGHSSSPFIWCEKGNNEISELIGGREHLAAWAKKKFPDDQELGALCDTWKIGDTFHDKPTSAQSTADVKEEKTAETKVAETSNPESSASEVAVDPKVQQILDLKSKCPDNLAIQCFDLAYYNSLNKDLQTRFLKCLDSGRENIDSGMGCYANHSDDYEVFFPFFKQALSRYHKVNLDEKKHVNNWSLEGVEGLPADGKLDLANLGLPALSMRVRTGRNLKKFPLPGSMTKQDRLDMETAMGSVFATLISDSQFGGRYVSITPGHKDFVDEKEYQQLVDEHIMFKDMSSDPYLNSAGISRDWPHGRGCYISEDKGFIIWVGEEDHLRIMAMQKGTILNAVFDRLKTAIDVVEKLIDGGCAYSPTFGVVTSCPTNIGTGMRASVHIALPNLTADGTDARAKAIAKPLGLSVRGLGGEHTPIGKDGTVDISPSARFCVSEAEIVTALYLGLSKLKAAEDAAKPAE